MGIQTSIHKALTAYAVDNKLISLNEYSNIALIVNQNRINDFLKAGPRLDGLMLKGGRGRSS
jgi:hypothetical protein